ncbi:MAG: hypothetical protein M3O28_14270 [Actinomycetota bacterium]|nr:hypothetical protein [Actinomycetota bacterium]
MLPTGPEYFLLLNGAGAVRSVCDEVTGWTDLSARKEVLYHLRGLKMDVDEGQDDVFLSSLEVPRRRRAGLIELERLLGDHAS